MDHYGFQWVAKDSTGFLCITKDSYGFLWGYYGFLWITSDSYEMLRIMDSKGILMSYQGILDISIILSDP